MLKMSGYACHSWLSRSLLFVRSAPYILARLEGLHQFTLTFPPEEQRRMKERLQRGNQDHLHVLYASQMAL